MLPLFLFLGIQVEASHIVGGYFRYDCNGLVGSALDSVEYSVEFLFYRDEINGTIITPDNKNLSIFDSGNQLVEVIPMIWIETNDVPDNISNPCVVETPNLRIVEDVYEVTIRLAKDEAHQLVYQRCCRNAVIVNLATPPSPFGPDYYGSTFQIDVPEFDEVGCNSSPDFSTEPPIVLCALIDVKDIGLNLSATDADGDSLVYSFCAPFDFNRNNLPILPPPRVGGNPSPDTANSPPYGLVPFRTPQLTASSPITSNPTITIDSETGEISGVPTRNNRTYVVGICVEEYRRSSGVLLSTTRRDVQITTGDCDPVIVSAVQNQQQFCDGFSVQFSNQSVAPQPGVEIQNYKWDFGVAGIDSDTSRETEPIFTFPSEGTYTITLIANPDLPCSDTSTEVFEVLPLLEPSITIAGQLCKNGNSVDFAAAGNYEPDATFSWDFGTSASMQNSTQETEDDIVFSGPSSSYRVTLTVSQDICSETIDTVFNLLDNPTVSFIQSDSADCYPFPIDFTNTSNTVGVTEFDWDFGDGNTSTLENPTHVYMQNGLYDVTLEVRTTEGCIDTVTLTKVNAVNVSLDSATNAIDFSFTPAEGCVPMTVQFTNNSTFDGVPSYIWDFQNGDISFDSDPTTIYTDTGTYSLSLLMITSGKCTDTLVRLISDTIRVNPVPISALTISDTAKTLKQAIFQFDGSASQFDTRSSFLINGVEVDTMQVLNYQFRDTGHHTIQYVAFNEFGCSDTSTAEVFVFDEFEFLIPNVFTPNNDGINETFAIRSCGVYDFEIQIFNRFGDRVFESNSLNINWDGRVSGREAEPGIYFYAIRILDFRGDYLNYNGTITLIVD